MLCQDLGKPSLLVERSQGQGQAARGSSLRSTPNKLSNFFFGRWCPLSALLSSDWRFHQELLARDQDSTQVPLVSAGETSPPLPPRCFSSPDGTNQAKLVRSLRSSSGITPAFR